MAFGTPTDGGAAYSSASGATVAPNYPAGIAANDVVVLIIGQKSSVANSGTVTTPTGWTLRESLVGAGGYGTTIGVDVGNTNLFIYTKNVVAGTETGSLTVTIGTNSISWGLIIRIPGGGSSSVSVGTADGSRTTAPTSGVAFTTLLTNGTTAPDFQSGDMAIWGMNIPTDVLVNGFTLPTISSTGTTFGTPVKLEEPDSAAGNDIGGYVAYALATAGSSTAAPTVGVTATGTVTNVRGPIALIRIRDTTQRLTPARYDEVNDFFSATITQTTPAQDIAPDRYDNINDFFSADVTQPVVAQSLEPSLYTNTNTFFAQTLTNQNTLIPTLYGNANTFLTHNLSKQNALIPALYTNANTFYAPIIAQAGGPQTLAPQFYTNTNSLFSAVVSASNAVAPLRYDNGNIFYSAALTKTNTVAPALFENANAFYPAKISYVVTFGPYVEDGYVETGYIGLALQNASTFYQATSVNLNVIVPPMFADSDFVFPPVVSLAGEPQALTASLFNNTNTFFPASIGATPIQPILGGGSLVRPRKKFRPAILFDFPEPKIALPDASAKAVVGSFSVTVELGSVIGTSPDPINSRTSLNFTQIETYTLNVRAESSWNDPSDDELLFILDFALD